MTGRVIQGLFSGGRPKLAAVQPRTAPPPIQAQTMARTPGPPATAFAVRAPGPPAPAFSGRPSVATAVAGQQGIVQRHGAGGAFAVDAGPLGLVSNGGRPLPEAVRGKMEAALGADFSAVRVHVGPQAERIGAIAFTVGSDIYFAPGRYQPDSIQGQQLLGHELTHVVQQRSGRVRNPLGSGLAVVQDHALEAEADRLGQRAATHRVAAQAKLAPGAAQPSAPVRISPPVSAGSGSYRLSAGAGGREIGSVMVHARDRGAVEVTDLGVSEAQRGNGVGRMLVAAAARTGLQSGRSKVTLAAQDRGSGHLTSWYKEMGFTQTGMNRFGYPKLEAPISRVLANTGQPGLKAPIQAKLANADRFRSPPGLALAAGPIDQGLVRWHVIQAMDSDEEESSEEEDPEYGEEAEYVPPAQEENDPWEYFGNEGAARPAAYNSLFNQIYTGGPPASITLTNSMGTTTYTVEQYGCDCGKHSSRCDTYVYIVTGKQWSPTTPVRKKKNGIYRTMLERPPMCHIVDWVVLRDALEGYCSSNGLTASTYEKFVCWGNIDNITTGRRTCNIKSNKGQKKFAELSPPRQLQILKYVAKMVKKQQGGTTTPGNYGGI